MQRHHANSDETKTLSTEQYTVKENNIWQTTNGIEHILPLEEVKKMSE
jgi:hypothetical protein